MQLSLVRDDERRHHTLIRRADGVSFHVAGVGLKFAIPHDLAHLAIERALGLRRGFWGSVADGAVFGSMTHVEGRRKPHAEERSRRLLEANHDTIGEAEYLVSLFEAALEGELRGGRRAEVALRAPLRERWVPPGRTPTRAFGDAEVAAACAAWREACAAWDALPVGGALHFEWPVDDAPRRRGRRPHGHSQGNSTATRMAPPTDDRRTARAPGGERA